MADYGGMSTTEFQLFFFALNNLVPASLVVSCCCNHYCTNFFLHVLSITAWTHSSRRLGSPAHCDWQCKTVCISRISIYIFPSCVWIQFVDIVVWMYVCVCVRARVRVVFRVLERSKLVLREKVHQNVWLPTPPRFHFCDHVWYSLTDMCNLHITSTQAFSQVAWVDPNMFVWWYRICQPMNSLAQKQRYTSIHIYMGDNAVIHLRKPLIIYSAVIMVGMLLCGTVA